MYIEQYLQGEGHSKKLVLRNYMREDIPSLIDVQKKCFPPPFPSNLWWNEEQLINHINLFPEGAICAEIDGEIVGSITSLLVNLKEESHTWSEITDNGYIRNHQPTGKTLYIVDISVKPTYRKFGIGKWLMQSLYYVVIELGLDRLAGGGRMPGFSDFAETLSPEEYIHSVLNGRKTDPVISFLLRCGRTPVSLLDNYLEDPESKNNALLMVWNNPFKIPKK